MVPATREDVEAVGFNRTMFASLFLSVSHSLVVCVCYFSLSLSLSFSHSASRRLLADLI